MGSVMPQGNDGFVYVIGIVMNMGNCALWEKKD